MDIIYKMTLRKQNTVVVVGFRGREGRNLDQFFAETAADHATPENFSCESGSALPSSLADCCRRFGDVGTLFRKRSSFDKSYFEIVNVY